MVTTHKDADTPIFIVGLGRSGTSLARSLINAHEAFGLAPSEIHFLDRWMPEFSHVDIAHSFNPFWEAFVAGKHFPRLQVDAAEARAAILAEGPPSWRSIYRTLLSQHASNVGRRRWGEKTPVYFRHIGQLLDWFPDASVVYVIRDPRGVAASHKVVGTAWADLDPGHVAKRWLESMRILGSWRGEPRVKAFRYEDIVAAPETTLTDLFHFLGEEFTPEVLERRSPDGSPPENGPFSTGAAVSAAHVEKWRDRLSALDVAIVEDVAGRTMERYGYEPVSTGMSPLTQTHVQAARAFRTVAHATQVLKRPRAAAGRLRRLAATTHRTRSK